MDLDIGHGFQPFFFHQGFDAPAFFPLLKANLVAPDMNEGSRKKGNDLIEHIAEHCIGRFIGRVIAVKVLPKSNRHRNFFARGPEFRIGGNRGAGMARHADLRYNGDVARCRIGHHLPDLLLGIKPFMRNAGTFRTVPSPDLRIGSF